MKTKLFTILITFFCLNLLSAQDCDLPTSTTTLQANNVVAKFDHGGTLWSNGYTVPDSDIPFVELNAFLTGHLWLGGVDPGGNVKVAADLGLDQGISRDFYAGPLADFDSPSPGSISAGDCALFNQHWIVSQQEIDDFLDDFQTDGEIDGTYNNVFFWPGRANPLYEQELGLSIPDQDLAPFVDLNNNNTYEPSLGEYPDIKGDQAAWWIFNDNGGLHLNTSGDALQFEVGVLAYAYANESETISNATFYELTLRNRALESIDSLFATLAFQVGLGCPVDDYFGCIPNENIGYMYNADAVDGIDSTCLCFNGISTYCNQPPALGIKIIDAPETDSKEADKLTKFSYFNHVSNPLPASIPNTPAQYYSRMSGSWKDGEPYKNQGDGTSEGLETSFLFSGNPSTGEGHSMCQAEIELDRRTMLMSMGPYSMNPGESNKICFAIYYVPIASACPDLTPIIEAGNELEAYCASNINAVDEFNYMEYSTVFPNPTKAQLNINATKEVVNVNLYDSQAKLVKSTTINGEKNVELDCSNIQSGMYILSITFKNGHIEKHKVILH